jgi:uncharacterized protein
MDQIQDDEAPAIFTAFDLWRGRFSDAEDAVSSDIRAAAMIIRRLDLNIRAPDAINLAIALRPGASLATFHRRMAENASALGVTIEAL